MTTQLTPNFSLEELTITQVRDVDNTPPRDAAEHLKLVAAALEQVRTLLGHPIIVNSGYRSPEVNAKVGGVPQSAHMVGYAADFICPAFGTPLEICKRIQADGSIRLDQCIEEGTWTHLSVDPRMRGEFLTKNGRGGYDIGLTRVVASA